MNDTEQEILSKLLIQLFLESPRRMGQDCQEAASMDEEMSDCQEMRDGSEEEKTVHHRRTL